VGSSPAAAEGSAPPDGAVPSVYVLAHGARHDPTSFELLWRANGAIRRRALAAADDAVARALCQRISAPRPGWAGLSMDRPRLMGILNVTPDSFSDGGTFLNEASAIAHGVAMAEAGADIIDVGGESTRPGAAPIGTGEEIRRVLPVVRALAERGIVVSLDTRHAPVMEAGLAAGAAIINDITALSGDPAALAVVARSDCAIVLMHMRGEPATMQVEPRYDCAPLDVFDFLAERLRACDAAGIDRRRLCVDPGIGFGKTLSHNCQILAMLALYHCFGVPVMVGASRKSFIAALSRGEAATERLGGSIAVALAGVEQGVQVLRVHDVAATAQALAVWNGIKSVVGTTPGKG
jgi:dihydropteroate synthase